MPKVSEKQLDKLFEAKIRDSEAFKRWFLGRTRFANRATSIVLTRSNHPWYKSRRTGKESETDILLVFKDIISDTIFAIHIENKLEGGRLTMDQAQTYSERALDWRNRDEYGRYDEYECILIAPRSFYNKNIDKAEIFDCFVPHEDISEYITAFAPYFPT